MISDSRSLLSAGRCLVVTTGTMHMCRQDELTDAIRPSGAAVVEIYYVAHLACCLCNEILCSKRLRGSPVTERTNIRCERPFAKSSPLRLPLCSPPACRQPRGSLPGWGRPISSSRLARTRATKHEAAHAETEAVTEDGRCCMHARCVITEHLADRRKSPVWSTEATYLLGSTAGVQEERSAALIYAGAPV
jgi:hypothetical protein